MSFGSKPILKHQKLGFKNKAMLFMLKHKLLKFDKVNEDELRGARLGKQSLKLSIIGYVLLILSALITTAGFLGLAGLVLCIISVIKGIKALNHKKGDTNAIVGIVLSSLFLLLFLLVITLIARYF